MQALELTFETTTPAFLRRRARMPELRPPSFRGLFRYWLRACAGAVLQNDTQDNLHELESAVWGNTAGASSVVVQLWHDGFAPERHFLVPHLAQAPEMALPASLRFTMLFRARAHTSPVVWATAKATVRLALLLGGIGARSRRGYGSCRVVLEGDNPVLQPVDLSAYAQHIQNTLHEALTATRSLAEQQQRAILAEPPSGPAGFHFPRFSKNGHIYVGEAPYATPAEALRDLMLNLTATGLNLGSHNPRRASPVWGRVIQVGQQYHLLFTVLASNVIPNLRYRDLHAALSPLAAHIVDVP